MTLLRRDETGLGFWLIWRGPPLYQVEEQGTLFIDSSETATAHSAPTPDPNPNPNTNHDSVPTPNPNPNYAGAVSFSAQCPAARGTRGVTMARRPPKGGADADQHVRSLPLTLTISLALALVLDLDLA